MWKNIIICSNNKERVSKLLEEVNGKESIVKSMNCPCVVYNSARELTQNEFAEISSHLGFSICYMAMDFKTEDNIIYFATKGKIDNIMSMATKDDRAKMKKTIQEA